MKHDIPRDASVIRHEGKAVGYVLRLDHLWSARNMKGDKLGIFTTREEAVEAVIMLREVKKS